MSVFTFVIPFFEVLFCIYAVCPYPCRSSKLDAAIRTTEHAATVARQRFHLHILTYNYNRSIS